MLPSGQHWGTCALLRCYESAQACPPGAGLVIRRRLYQVTQLKVWAHTQHTHISTLLQYINLLTIYFQPGTFLHTSIIIGGNTTVYAVITFNDSDTDATAFTGNLNDPYLCHVTRLCPYPLPLHLKTTIDEMLANIGNG